ncbi:MAG: tetratricopeptide repeat protein [Pseudanabaenaceae cyanobacterium bins.68]|nr:tetratricopeptide repeat protein [Pseudanabaenaceae cyanobacterium bins.68]
MSNHLEQAILAFEHGNYQEAIALLLTDNSNDPQVQLWLANAYSAVDQTEKAIAICQKLKTYPDRQVRKDAAYIAEILTAPSLSKLANVNLEIPPLTDWDNSENSRALKFKSIPAIAPNSRPTFDQGDDLPHPPTPNSRRLADQLVLLIGILLGMGLVLILAVN